MYTEFTFYFFPKHSSEDKDLGSESKIRLWNNVSKRNRKGQILSTNSFLLYNKKRGAGRVRATFSVLLIRTYRDTYTTHIEFCRWRLTEHQMPLTSQKKKKKRKTSEKTLPDRNFSQRPMWFCQFRRITRAIFWDLGICCCQGNGGREDECLVDGATGWDAWLRFIEPRQMVTSPFFSLLQNTTHSYG